MLDRGLEAHSLPSLADSRRASATVVAIACAVVAALSVQEYFARHWAGGPRSYSAMLFAQLIGAAVWAVFFPLIIRPVTDRVPVTTRGFVQHLLIGAGV